MNQSLPEKIKIVYLANVWWNETKFSKQELASALSKNSEVSYFNPPLHFVSWLKNAKRWHYWRNRAEKINPNLTVYTFVTLFPWHRFRAFIPVHSWFLRRALEKRDLLSSADLAIFNSPGDFRLPRYFQKAKTVFHWTDDYSALPKRNPRPSAEWQIKMIENADLILAVSKNLLDQAKKHNPNTVFFPNAVNVKRLQYPNDIEIENQSIFEKHPVVGFCGTINERIDQKILREIAELNPDISLVFIGHDEINLAAKFNQPNIHFISAKAPDEIGAYLDKFDIGFIPYKNDEFNRASMPLKIYEYLLFGKPVIATDFSKLDNFGELITKVESAEQFGNIVKKTLAKNNQAKMQSRRDFALANNWQARAEELITQANKIEKIANHPNRLKFLLFSTYPEIEASVRVRFLQHQPSLKEQGIKLTHHSIFSKTLYQHKNSREWSWKIINVLLLIKGLIGRISAILLIAPFCDGVIVHKEVFPFFPVGFSKLLKLINKNIIFDFNDALYTFPQHLKDWRKGGNPAINFPKVLKQANLVSVSSPILFDYAKKYVSSVILYPDSIKVDQYHIKDHQNNHPLVIGWIGTYPNMEYLKIIIPALKKLAREKDFIFRIIGPADKINLDLSGIKNDYHVWSLEREKDLLKSIDIGVMPLSDSEWEKAKSGFKLVQYMARGIPFVASPVGYNIDLAGGGEKSAGLIADSSDQWLEKLKLLLDNPNLRQKMGEAGRQYVLENHNAEKEVQKLISILKKDSGLKSDSEKNHPLEFSRHGVKSQVSGNLSSEFSCDRNKIQIEEKLITTNEKISQPIDAVLAITYLCNSRCSMCNIWKLQKAGTLTAEDYQKLPASLRYINLSGGEPFLRDDLPQIVKNIKIRCPKAEIIISSNGFTPDLIERKMKEIMNIAPNIGIALSLDGVNEMHDEIRGIPGGFNKVTETLKRLKSLGLKNIRFAFTAQDKNIDHYQKVYDLAKEEGVQFTCAVAQGSKHYFMKEDKKLARIGKFQEQFNYVKKQELRSWSPKKWARAYFIDGLYRLVSDKPRPLTSGALQDFFFLDPFGNVYPSNIDSHIVGNITDNDFSNIWSSKKASSVRKELRQNPPRDWMICTARTAILNHPLKVIAWIIGNKLKSHVSR